MLNHYRASGRVPGTVDHTLRLLDSWHADMDALRHDLEARPIELPTLVLWGDHDRVVPEHTAAGLERYVTHCEHNILQGIGHLPNEEAAAECGALIVNWLDRTLALPR